MTLFESGGLWALCVMIALEYACFPLPSEVLLPLAGALCARGGIGLGVIFPLSVLAGLLGCSFCYWVGRIGGNRFLNWLMKRVPKSRKGIEASGETFNHYAHLAVCAGRMVPICRTYISFIAGAGGQRFGGFLWYSFLGIACWNLLLLGAGFYLGERWEMVSGYYDELKGFVVLLVLVGLGVFVLKKSLLSKKVFKR